MSRSNFSLPQRQSQYAVIFIILRFFRGLVRQAWPLVFAAFLGRGSSSMDFFEMALYGFGVIGLVPSIISYFKYYYHLDDDALIINKGILKKVTLKIPFERIQSVNFKQSFLHQMLKVTELEIETAGSNDQESQIDAIEIALAEDLRRQILEKKNAITSTHSIASKSDLEISDESTTILSLSTTDLLKVGLVQNHLKPIGLIFGLGFSLLFYSYSGDVDFRSMFSDYYDQVSGFSYATIAILVLIFIVGSVIYSLMTTLFRHYNLLLTRSGSKFQIVQGLFTKQQFAALDNKIQFINWGQSFLEKMLRYNKLYFRQARSNDRSGDTQKNFGVPGCRAEQIEYVFTSWLGSPDVIPQQLYAVSVHYFIHGALYTTLICTSIASGLFYFGLIPQSIMLVSIMMIILVTSWLRYKKKKFGWKDGLLYISGGTFGARHMLLPIYKVQNISLESNPYQHRRGLATLMIYTAAGPVEIPYIPETMANQLLDKIIYEVEISKKPWM